MTVVVAVASRRRADVMSGSDFSLSKVFPKFVLCDSLATIISGWSCTNALFKTYVSIDITTYGHAITLRRKFRFAGFRTYSETSLVLQR